MKMRAWVDAECGKNNTPASEHRLAAWEEYPGLPPHNIGQSVLKINDYYYWLGYILVIMTPEIQRFLSIHRLTPYRLPGETADTAFSRYQWNIKLAEALLPSINYLEIGLRNGLDGAISSIYCQYWILSPPYQLRMSEDDERQIQGIQYSIQKVKGYPAKHDDVLAALGFGFWIAFFHKRYVPGLWSRGKNPLEAIFPSMPVALRIREQIFTRLRTIKTLRNRIAQHEPIWKMTPTVDETHHTCLEIVLGMSIAAAEELAKIDWFSSVYANGLKEMC